MPIPIRLDSETDLELVRAHFQFQDADLDSETFAVAVHLGPNTFVQKLLFPQTRLENAFMAGRLNLQTYPDAEVEIIAESDISERDLLMYANRLPDHPDSEPNQTCGDATTALPHLSDSALRYGAMRAARTNAESEPDQSKLDMTKILDWRRVV